MTENPRSRTLFNEGAQARINGVVECPHKDPNDQSVWNTGWKFVQKHWGDWHNFKQWSYHTPVKLPSMKGKIRKKME